MGFMTDRKRASGTGSAKSGTQHHWLMMVTSVALLILIPLFIFTFGSTLGRPYEEVIAYYSKPWPAMIAALTFMVGFFHYSKGVQTLIVDYVHGLAGKALIIGTICLSYMLAAFGVFAVIRMAL